MSHDSYAELHSRHKSQDKSMRSRDANATVRPSVTTLESIVSDLNSKANKTELQEIAFKLSEAEAKIASLTNVIKLVQKYTETQDLQYEKERQSLMNREAVLTTMIKDQMKKQEREERRIFELDQLQQKYRLQLESLKKFRESDTNLRSHIESQKTFKFDHREQLESLELKQSIREMENNLRTQLNKKVSICMEILKEAPTKQQCTVMQQDIQRLGHTVDHIKQQSRTTSPKPILKADYVKQEQLQDLQRSIDEKINQAADRFTQVVKRYVGKSPSPSLRRLQPLSANPETVKKQEPDRHHYPRISEYDTNKQKREPSKKQKVSHTSEDQRERSRKSRSRSRSLSRQSKKSQGKSFDSRNIMQKRREKEQQLREMMRKTKMEKDKLKKKAA